jgi:hypothetical protein
MDKIKHFTRGLYDYRMFSVWFVLLLYNEIPRITETVESELELAE